MKLRKTTMKSRILALILMIMVLLCSCNKEKKVPEEIILENISSYYNGSIGYNESIEYSNYSISHSYNEETNIDDVWIVFQYEEAYITTTYDQTYSYQYYKDSDSWRDVTTSEQKKSNIFNFKIELNEEALKSNSPWEGAGYSYKYSITVDSVDNEKGTMTVTYLIDYDSNYKEDVSGTQTVTYMTLLECDFSIKTGEHSFEHFKIDGSKGITK